MNLAYWRLDRTFFVALTCWRMPVKVRMLIERLFLAAVLNRAYGVRKLGKGEKLTPNHIFHFASVSKHFVATAVVQLAEKGKLKLDDPVVKHLPYFRLADERYREITIRQMLNHTAGMPDVEDYEWDKPQFDKGAAERYVRSMSSEKLLWAPGTDWKYSNMVFDVLGDLIAKLNAELERRRDDPLDARYPQLGRA